jgi:hypothetical protein
MNFYKVCSNSFWIAIVVALFLSLGGVAMATPTLLGWRPSNPLGNIPQPDPGLVSIDTATGQTTLIFGSDRNISGLAYDFTSHILYGVEDLDGDDMLVNIDPYTGMISDIVSLAGLTRTTGIGFDQTYNMLFGVERVSEPGDARLVKINPVDGQNTQVTDGLPPSFDISIQPSTGDVFGNFITDPAVLYRIDPGTGDADHIDHYAWWAWGLAFEPDSEVLYSFVEEGPTNIRGFLATVDFTLPDGPATATLIGEGSENSIIRNLTFAEYSVPEPSTLFLIGTGLIGLVGFRRQFRV